MNETHTPQRRFDEDFKRQAVALLLQGGKPAKQLAQELGIHLWNLRDWKRRYGPPQALGVSRSAAQLEADLRLLRRENERLRLQRDILKKTLGILSEAPPSDLRA